MTDIITHLLQSADAVHKNGYVSTAGDLRIAAYKIQNLKEERDKLLEILDTTDELRTARLLGYREGIKHLEAERNEALDQLSSMTHCVHVLEKRVETLEAERDNLRELVDLADHAQKGLLMGNVETARATTLVFASFRAALGRIGG